MTVVLAVANGKVLLTLLEKKIKTHAFCYPVNSAFVIFCMHRPAYYSTCTRVKLWNSLNASLVSI